MFYWTCCLITILRNYVLVGFKLESNRCCLQIKLWFDIMYRGPIIIGYLMRHAEHVERMQQSEWISLYVAFSTIMAISRQKETRSLDYALLLFRITSMVLYSAQYHRQHYTLQAFEQFGSLYMHNHDYKYPARPEFELLQLGPPGYKPRSIRMSHRAGIGLLYSRHYAECECVIPNCTKLFDTVYKNITGSVDNL